MISVKHNLRDGRTDGEASLRPSVHPFVSSFVYMSVVPVRGVHPMEERTAMLHRNSRGK